MFHSPSPTYAQDDGGKLSLPSRAAASLGEGDRFTFPWTLPVAQRAVGADLLPEPSRAIPGTEEAFILLHVDPRSWVPGVPGAQAEAGGFS